MNGGQKEWVDEAEFTNGDDGIKMGPFVDNLYKRILIVYLCLKRIAAIPILMSLPTIHELTILTQPMFITPIMLQVIIPMRMVQPVIICNGVAFALSPNLVLP